MPRFDGMLQCREAKGGCPLAVRTPGQSGFTYIELMVVLAILAMFFFLTLPHLDSYTFVDPPKKVASLIATTSKDLKTRARKENKRFRLEIASETGEIWVTHEGMDKKAREEARKGAFTVPEELSVTFASGTITTDEETGVKGIFYYPGGYSDPAIILLRDGGRSLLVAIEPFLSRALITVDNE